MTKSKIQVLVLKAEGLTTSLEQPHFADVMNLWHDVNSITPSKQWHPWDNEGFTVKDFRWWWYSCMEKHVRQVIKTRKLRKVELHSYCFVIRFFDEQGEECYSGLETTWVPLSDDEASQVNSYALALVEQMCYLSVGLLIPAGRGVIDEAS